MEKSKVKVIVARPGEKAYVTEIVPDYKTLSALVGGHIELTYPVDDEVAIISDECSKLKGKMPNRTVFGSATPKKCPLYKGINPDVYAGTIVIIGDHGDTEDFDSLKEHELELYMKLYGEPQFVTNWFGKQ